MVAITVGIVIGIAAALIGAYLFTHVHRTIGLPVLLTGVAIVASGLMNVPLIILLIPALLVSLVVMR